MPQFLGFQGVRHDLPPPHPRGRYAATSRRAAAVQNKDTAHHQAPGEGPGASLSLGPAEGLPFPHLVLASGLQNHDMSVCHGSPCLW